MEFKYSVAMIVTEEQFNNDLKQPLLKIGFKDGTWGDWNESNILLTMKKFKKLGNYYSPNGIDIIIDYYNPQLFLALAAMNDNKQGNIGEYWYYFSNNKTNSFINGKLYKQITPNINDLYALKREDGGNDGWSGENLQKFRKATVEEIMEKFNYVNKNVCFQSDGTLGTGIKIIEELKKLGGENRYDKTGIGIQYPFYYVDKNKFIDHSNVIPEGYELVNLNKENNMEKEIIGYKLIKPEYEAAALKITTQSNVDSWEGNLRTNGWNFQDKSYCANKLRRAGVLDLWFEPIYKEVKQVIVLTLSNGKQVTVTKGGLILAEGKGIDVFKLKALYSTIDSWYESLNGWNVTVGTLEIGCWKNVTKKDLKLILETQKKQIC